MSDIRRMTSGTVAIRQDADGDGRTLDGYAYQWGETTDGAEEFPGLLESFERGAFASAIATRGDRPTPFLDRHGGVVIGGITFDEDDTGLHYSGRLLDTTAAREYAATVEVNNGVSLEWVMRGAKSKRSGKNVVHTHVPLIAALAGEYAPAYRGASVALRSGGDTSMEQDTVTPQEPAPVPMTRDQITALTTEVANEAFRSFAERGFATGPTDPAAGYETIGELVHAAFRSTARSALTRAAAGGIARRALDDTTFNSGANAALASGNLVTQELQRLVNRGRPAITAFGGPRPLGGIAGLTLEWPYFDGTLSDFVAAQSAEKAAITSASVDIKLGTEALVTYAGGTDVSLQVLRRGQPGILDMYARIWLASWAAVTDAAFVTELESGSVTSDTAEAISAMDLAEFTALLITNSIAVEAATGQPAEFILASTTMFSRLANLIAASSTAIAGASSSDIAGLNFQVNGVRIIHDVNVTAGKAIISNRMAAAWYEDGPFLVTDLDVEKLGQNVAYYSMGAGARFIPAAIIELYDVTP